MSPSHLVPVPDSDAAVAQLFENLGAQLWSERELLEDLLYVLVAQRLVLQADLTEFLVRTDDDVRAATARLQDAEVVRAFTAEALNRRYGLVPGAPLGALVEVAPEPWATLLADHRRALRELTGRVNDVAAGVEGDAHGALQRERESR